MHLGALGCTWVYLGVLWCTVLYSGVQAVMRTRKQGKGTKGDGQTDRGQVQVLSCTFAPVFNVGLF